MKKTSAQLYAEAHTTHLREQHDSIREELSTLRKRATKVRSVGELNRILSKIRDVSEYVEDVLDDESGDDE